MADETIVEPAVETEKQQEEEPKEEEDDSMDEDDVTAGLVFATVMLIYLMLAVVSAGTVYAAFGWTGQGSTGNRSNLYTRVTGMINYTSYTLLNKFKPAVNQTVNVTTTQPPAEEWWACPDPYGACPADDPFTCLTPNPNMPIMSTTCKPQTPAPCKKDTWPARMICPPVTYPPGCQHPPSSNNCPPPTCPPLKTSNVDIQSDFRDVAFLETKSWSEWIGMFPPNSSERLEVVTTLLDETLEKLVRVGFVHPCERSGYNTWYKDVCYLCPDRYEYIRCVMSQDILVNPSSAKVRLYTSQELDGVEALFTEAVYNADSYRNDRYKFMAYFNLVASLRDESSIEYVDPEDRRKTKSCQMCKENFGAAYLQCVYLYNNYKSTMGI